MRLHQVTSNKIQDATHSAGNPGRDGAFFTSLSLVTTDVSHTHHLTPEYSFARSQCPATSVVSSLVRLEPITRMECLALNDGAGTRFVGLEEFYDCVETPWLQRKSKQGGLFDVP